MTEESSTALTEEPLGDAPPPRSPGITRVASSKVPVIVPLVVILLVAGGSALYARLKSGGSAESRVASGRLFALVGQAAPPFALRDLGGSTVTLKDAAGSPLIINGWATWCVPCRQEMPAIQRAYEARRATGLKVYAIDAAEDPAAVQAFQTRLNLTLPILIDDGSFEKAYGVIGLPSSVFVDRHGIVRSVQLGQMSEQVLQEKLDTIVGPGAPT